MASESTRPRISPGHQRTFSETLADVAPEEWGGRSSIPASGAILLDAGEAHFCRCTREKRQPRGGADSRPTNATLRLPDRNGSVSIAACA